MNSSKTVLPNPYTEKTYDGHLMRMQGFIGEDDYKFVVRVSDNSGCVRAVVSNFWQKLVKALKDHGITDFSKSNEFVNFIINMQIVDGRNSGVGRTVGGTPASGSEQGQDTGSGATPMASAHSGDAVKHSVVQSGTGAKTRRSGKVQGS